MKILVLIAGGRAGSDFFQSLLDGHSEISQFPGVFFYDEFWNKIKKEGDTKKIAQIFINDNQHFFDSRKNLRERHNILGNDKNGYYVVNKDLFVKHFIYLMKNKSFNKKEILLSLNIKFFKNFLDNLFKKK